MEGRVLRILCAQNEVHMIGNADKFARMSGLIAKHLENSPHEDLKVDFIVKAVEKALEYCIVHNFEKTMNPIQHPLECNRIEENVSQYDAKYIYPIKDNF